MVTNAIVEALNINGFERFEDGWDTFDHLDRTGRPKTARHQSNIELIERILDEDMRATVRELEDRVGIPKSTIQKIIREDLEMSRVVARWVPKHLSEENKRERVKSSRLKLGGVRKIS